VNFNEETHAYEIFRDLMKQQYLGDAMGVDISHASTDTEEVCRSVTCEATLRAIQQAQSQAGGM
jgi:hypothetical protein